MAQSVFVYDGPELYRRGDSVEAFDYSCMKLGEFASIWKAAEDIEKTIMDNYPKLLRSGKVAFATVGTRITELPNASSLFTEILSKRHGILPVRMHKKDKDDGFSDIPLGKHRGARRKVKVNPNDKPFISGVTVILLDDAQASCATSIKATKALAKADVGEILKVYLADLSGPGPRAEQRINRAALAFHAVTRLGDIWSRPTTRVTSKLVRYTFENENNVSELSAKLEPELALAVFVSSLLYFDGSPPEFADAFAWRVGPDSPKLSNIREALQQGKGHKGWQRLRRRLHRRFADAAFELKEIVPTLQRTLWRDIYEEYVRWHR